MGPCLATGPHVWLRPGRRAALAHKSVLNAMQGVVNKDMRNLQFIVPQLLNRSRELGKWILAVFPFHVRPAGVILADPMPRECVTDLIFNATKRALLAKRIPI